MGDELLRCLLLGQRLDVDEEMDERIALDHCLGEWYSQPRGVGRLKSSLYMRHTLNGLPERMLFVNRYRNLDLGYLRDSCTRRCG